MDEQQIDRHYSADQLKDLYQFVPSPKEQDRLAPPKDQLLSEVISNDRTKSWILKYHMHDSLLEHKPEESLSKDEIDKAWEEYENEKKGIFTHMRPQNTFNTFNNRPYSASVENANWVHGLSVSYTKVYFGQNVIFYTLEKYSRKYHQTRQKSI